MSDRKTSDDAMSKFGIQTHPSLLSHLRDLLQEVNPAQVFIEFKVRHHLCQELQPGARKGKFYGYGSFITVGDESYEVVAKEPVFDARLGQCCKIRARRLDALCEQDDERRRSTLYIDPTALENDTPESPAREKLSIVLEIPVCPTHTWFTARMLPH